MMQAPQNCVHVSILAVCSLYRTLPRLTYPLFTIFTDAVTELRRNFVARLKILDPLVESNLIIHLFAISLLLWIWGISLARAHTLTLFSFHPVFMSMGCVLFMTEGILVRETQDVKINRNFRPPSRKYIFMKLTEQSLKSMFVCSWPLLKIFLGLSQPRMLSISLTNYAKFCSRQAAKYSPWISHFSSRLRGYGHGIYF